MPGTKYSINSSFVVIYLKMVVNIERGIQKCFVHDPKLCCRQHDGMISVELLQHLHVKPPFSLRLFSSQVTDY